MCDGEERNLKINDNCNKPKKIILGSYWKVIKMWYFIFKLLHMILGICYKTM